MQHEPEVAQGSNGRHYPGPQMNGAAMSDKFPRQSMTKRSGKSLEDKPAEKRAKAGHSSSTGDAAAFQEALRHIRNSKAGLVDGTAVLLLTRRRQLLTVESASNPLDHHLIYRRNDLSMNRLSSPRASWSTRCTNSTSPYAAAHAGARLMASRIVSLAD